VKCLTRTSTLCLAFAVALTACTDTVGLDDEEFDPTASAADLIEVAGILDSPVLASLAISSMHFNSIPGAPSVSTDFVDAGWDLAFSDGAWDVDAAGTQLSNAMVADVTALILIPPEFRGRTYVYNPSTGQYYHDPDRGGAPANGVRFILYDVHTDTQDIGATEIGYVDLMDESTEISRIVRLVAVSADTEHVNYTVSQTILTGSVRFDILGFYGNPEVDRFGFDLSLLCELEETSSTVTLDYHFDVPGQNFVMDATVVLMHDALTQTSSSTLDIRFQQATRTLRMVGGCEGDLGSIEVYVDHQPFAYIAVTPDSITVTGADGQDLTEQYAAAVQAMFDTLEEIFVGRWSDFIQPVAFLFCI